MMQSSSSDFSILPEGLEQQYRQTYLQRQTLKALVFNWQSYWLALPMAAAQKVIPLSPMFQQQMITESQIQWNGVVIQIITLPVCPWDSAILQEQDEEDHFILLFVVPDGRILGVPITSLPNVLEFPLYWFSPINPDLAEQSELPFRDWIKFVAQPSGDMGSELLPSTVYLLDLDQLQVHFPPVDLSIDWSDSDTF